MFQFSERHIEEYETLGYTVFHDIIPPKLIDELRVECERGAEQARAKDGMQTQRFQPLTAYDINLKPFEEYRQLPDLNDAIARIVSHDFVYGDASVMGVLLEPASEPWCTQWHRDWRDNIQGLDLDRWQADYQDRALFNQVNCALYEDSCTWVVPGSHLRRDTPEEVAVFPERPIPGPNLGGKSSAEKERACLEYCQSLPGAQRLLLDAGDFCLYRNSLWHLGNYIPYRKRATLHDGVMTDKFRQWVKDNIADAQRRTESGIGWENPNPRPVVIA